MARTDPPTRINLILPQHLAGFWYERAKANGRASTGSQIMWELDQIMKKELEDNNA